MKVFKKLKRPVIYFGVFGIITSSILFFSFKNQDFKIVKSLDIYFTLFKELNLFYVDETNPEDLVETSINAMLKSLDPYTTYIPEKELDDFKFMTTGKYGGIGAVIRRKDDFTMVVEPYKGSPAQIAGLRAGDMLKKIDGKSLEDLNIEDVSKLLKGVPNTKVTIQYERPFIKEKEEVILTRKEIVVPSVPFHGMLDNKYAYIRLSSFKQNCSEDVKNAFVELKKNSPEGLILDLRSNPGGLMLEAVRIVNLFVEKDEKVVYTKGKLKEYDFEYFTKTNPIDTEIPIVVLVSRGSASASEIVAGSLQDLDRAVIVGRRTYGKGLVQSTRPLSYNSQLKVTTAKYYIPSGRCVQALDFSNRNEDGSVGTIPDSLISDFLTRNKRLVKDGGGVTPDFAITPDYLSKFSVILLTKDLIFDYVTKYRTEHQTIDNPMDFKFTDADFEHFMAYANDIEFDYETDSERELHKLEEIAKKEKYFSIAEEEFKALRKKLGRDKFKDFEIFKEEIKELIEEDIISRYYFRDGVIKRNLEDDKQLLKAKEILSDQEEIITILKGGYQKKK